MRVERLLYVSDLGSEGLMHLCTMNPDGSDPRRLTRTPEPEPEGMRSPDGKRIACSVADSKRNGSDIYVLDADGSGRKRLTTSPPRVHAANPYWSPDGRRIAYSVLRPPTDKGASATIWTMADDGKDARERGRGMLPNWSPDGKRLLVTDIPAGGGPDAKPSLFGIDIDGGNRRLLIADAAMGVWSPDGLRIACIVIDPKGAMNVAVCNADGKGARPLTQLDDPFVSGPVWLDDGKTIAFTRALPPGAKASSPDMALYTVPATGGAPRRLSRGGTMNFIGNGSSLFLLIGALAGSR